MISSVYSRHHKCFTAHKLWVPLLIVNVKKSTSKKQESHDPKKIKTDLIGPADPVSNLRPVLFKIPDNETELEKKLRIQREEVQRWNQHFWLQHNDKFYKLKQDFVRMSTADSDIAKTEKKALTSEQMSVFYKDFLDKNWEVHLKYNVEWYKKNFKLLFLSFRVVFENFKRKFVSS